MQSQDYHWALDYEAAGGEKTDNNNNKNQGRLPTLLTNERSCRGKWKWAAGSADYVRLFYMHTKERRGELARKFRVSAT